jgi:hypothetical protein
MVASGWEQETDAAGASNLDAGATVDPSTAFRGITPRHSLGFGVLLTLTTAC